MIWNAGAWKKSLEWLEVLEWCLGCYRFWELLCLRPPLEPLNLNKQCVLQFRIRKLPLLLVPIPAPWPSKLENEHWTTVLEKLQTAKMSQSSVSYEEQCKISMNEIVANQTYPLVKGLHTVTKWVLSWECRVGLVCGSVLQKTILLE